jgi:hypothetical protein
VEKMRREKQEGVTKKKKKCRNINVTGRRGVV